MARHRRSVVSSAVLTALLSSSAVACSDDGDDSETAEAPTTTSVQAAATTGATGSVAGGAEAGTVVIDNFIFSPATAEAGSEVSVRNDDSVTHTLTSDDGGDAFDSGAIETDSTATFTAPAEAGPYAFHCNVHPTMTGMLVVG